MLKFSRLLIVLGLIGLAFVALARRRGGGGRTGLDAAQGQELLAAVKASYASTLAAFDPSGDELGAFAERDARAAADAEALQRTFERVKPALRTGIVPSVTAFADAVAEAQVQIMAFAINRKNRGLPDAAQSEAEGDDLRSFETGTKGLYQQLVSAFS
jgi:hypothetical protein